MNEYVVGYQYREQFAPTLRKLCRLVGGSVRTQDIEAVWAAGGCRQLDEVECRVWEAFCESIRCRLTDRVYVVSDGKQIVYRGSLPWVADRILKRVRGTSVELIERKEVV